MNELLIKIREALAANAQCAPGILGRDRLAFTPIGELSFLNDRELFVQVSTAIYGHWYGHVLRLLDVGDGRPQWAAVLVESGVDIDAPDVETLFQRVRHHLAEHANYTPPFAQEKEDVFALRSSFDEAVLALVGMIERFDILLRTNVAYDFGAYTKPPCHTGNPDCSCMHVYGLHCDLPPAEPQERGWQAYEVPWPPVPYWDKARFLDLIKTTQLAEKRRT